MMNPLDTDDLADCICAAGYSADTAVAVGVSGLFGKDIVASSGFTPDGRVFAADTMVYTGSLAKQITAACAAMLVRSGELSTNHAITNWLHELPVWAHSIQVRHLIHHTANLPSEDAVWNEMRRVQIQDRTSSGIVEALARLSNHHADPGIAYSYSNCGYVCLALIIERITGQSLSVFADKHIFKPLRMTNTCFWDGPEPRPSTGVALDKSLSPAPLSVGDGGFWSTLNDLLRWSDGINHNKLSIAEMIHRVGNLDDGTALDYAWGTRVFSHHGFEIQSHGGSWPGSTAKLIRLPGHQLSILALALDDDVNQIVALTDAVLNRVLVDVSAG